MLRHGEKDVALHSTEPWEVQSRLMQEHLEVADGSSNVLKAANYLE